MPNSRLTVIGAAALSAVLLVLCIVLDQVADEDSTLGTLADWSWVAFLVSLVLLIVVSIWALLGRYGTARSRA